MNKYIIKNCYAITSHSGDKKWKSATCTKYKDCQDCSDCLLKRIVEKCRDMTADRTYYAYDFAKEILDLLAIEEVE